jgi:dihydrofolate reductase
MANQSDRKLIVSTLMTLDGVVTGQAQWASSYFDAGAKALALATLRDFDLFLLGRKAYQQFAPRWSQIDDGGYFAAINAMPKVVLSNSLEAATWNATVLGGDAAARVRALKQEPGKNILKYGVTELDRTLIAHQLIDEFHFLICPIVVDHGKRVFEGIDTSRLQLELMSSHRTESGMVGVSYRALWR